MRRRFLLWATLIALGLGAVSFFVTAPNFPSKVTQENFNRVEEGMSEAELEAILGPPGYYYRYRPHAVVEHGIVFRRYWLGDEGCIIIELAGPDNEPDGIRRVGRKDFFPLAPETYGERWLRRLRDVVPVW